MSWPCAVCGHGVEPDSDHVKIEEEVVWTDDRNDKKDYVLHLDCAIRTIDGWEEAH